MGCSAVGDDDSGRGQRTPTVGYILAQYSDVPMVSELAGRVVAFQSSEVRPQIAGIVRRRLFTEGSLVAAGQPLYQIDPRLYRAAVNEANANLASARANADATRVRAERFRPLAEMQAISQQDYTDAQAAARAAGAAVEQSRAQLDTARINLAFTTITAPIGGRIGRSLVTEGALVTMSQPDPLAIIQRIDPVYVDIQQAGSQMIALRRDLAAGGAGPASMDVRLLLEDGSEYGLVGRLEFAEALANAATGTVTLRARFANPQGLLLPGMFVRARFAPAIDWQAMLIPQVAVSRDERGKALVWVAGADDKVVRRVITTTRTDGANWVVTDGLKPGDRVVTQGVAICAPARRCAKSYVCCVTVVMAHLDSCKAKCTKCWCRSQNSNLVTYPPRSNRPHSIRAARLQVPSPP
ncbi:MAG: efflux RND transporter periplasmic adaptor subunit, partial [Sphingopyxis sp.]|nr:efflux RND transporter periplasmic adaptor subunit [Sphingopyxis sp.]